MLPASHALMDLPDAAHHEVRESLDAVVGRAVQHGLDVLTRQHREQRPGLLPFAHDGGVGQLGAEHQPADAGDRGRSCARCWPWPRGSVRPRARQPRRPGWCRPVRRPPSRTPPRRRCPCRRSSRRSSGWPPRPRGRCPAPSVPPGRGCCPAVRRPASRRRAGGWASRSAASHAAVGPGLGHLRHLDTETDPRQYRETCVPRLPKRSWRCDGQSDDVRAARHRRDAGRAAGFDDGLMGVALLAGAANVIMQLARPGVGYGVHGEPSGERPGRPAPDQARTHHLHLPGGRDRRAPRSRSRRSGARSTMRTRRCTPRRRARWHYNAFDKDLQLWVAACIYKGGVDVYRLFVGEMDDQTADRHYRDGHDAGHHAAGARRRCGLPTAPRSTATGRSRWRRCTSTTRFASTCIPIAVSRMRGCACRARCSGPTNDWRC